MKTTTFTPDMIIQQTEKWAMYKHPKDGYLLYEKATGDGRYMPARQAKNYLKLGVK